jgi:hypothetical protein
MAIQKVSVSTKAYQIPQQRQRELKDVVDFPYFSDTVTEENLIELDYVYELNGVAKQQVLLPELTIESPKRTEQKFRYPTLGVNFIDRDVSEDENGIEEDPIIDKIDIETKETINRIVTYPNSWKMTGTPSWDWSADHAKKVWDNSLTQLNDEFQKISDQAKQMGKDIVNSLFGFNNSNVATTHEERLPVITGQLYSLAYVPFMTNTAEKPSVDGDSDTSNDNRPNWGNFFKDILKQDDSKYPIYPPWIPKLTSITFEKYLHSEDRRITDGYISGQNDMTAFEWRMIHQRIGLYKDKENRMASGENVLVDSRAYFPPDLNGPTRTNSFYDVNLPVSSVDEFYKEMALKHNTIGDSSSYIIQKLREGNSVESKIVEGHFQKLAYFPLQFDKDGKYIIPEGMLTGLKEPWKEDDFYNISNTETDLHDYETKISQFYQRVTLSNNATKTPWDYNSPYKVTDLVKEYITNKLSGDEKDKFAETFKRYDVTKSDSSKRALSRSSAAGNFSSYAMLEKIGPDFLQHKFDAYFLWDIFSDNAPKDWDEILQKEEYDWLSDFEKYVLSKKGFAVRFGQVSIPKIANDEFSIPFLETDIKKIRSSKTMNNQSSFTIRLDQNLIWLDMINGMAGHMNVIDEHLFTSTTKHPYLKSIEREPKITGNSGNPKRWRTVLKLISRSWPPGSIKNSYNIKDSELCLVVKMSHLSNLLNTNKQQKVLPYFVFENVRILGTSDKILYSKEANIQSLTVNFIFKRCYEVTQGYTKLDQFSENKWINTSNTNAENTLEYSKIDPRKYPEFYQDPMIRSTHMTEYYGLPKTNTYEDSLFDWLESKGDHSINVKPTLTGDSE